MRLRRALGDQPGTGPEKNRRAHSPLSPLRGEGAGGEGYFLSFSPRRVAGGVPSCAASFFGAYLKITDSSNQHSCPSVARKW